MAGVIRRAWSAVTFEASWLVLMAWKMHEDHRGPVETEDTPHG